MGCLFPHSIDIFTSPVTILTRRFPDLMRRFVGCHAGMATLLRRHGNVVTPAWQRCYAGMATHDAACSLRYNPLRNGYLGDKIGIFERKTTEFILCVLSALFLPKSSPPNGDGHSIFFVSNHLTQSVFAVVWR